MKKTIRKIVKQHGYSFAEWDGDLLEDFYACKCGASLGELEASELDYPSLEDWHARHVAKKITKAVKKVKAKAWKKGLSAGRDRWQDNREFGDFPVNPYGKAN